MKAPLSLTLPVLPHSAVFWYCHRKSNVLPRKAQQPSTKVLLFNASLSPQSPRVGCFLSLPPVLDSGQGQGLALVTSIWAVMTVLNAVGPCGLQYTMGTGTFQKRWSLVPSILLPTQLRACGLVDTLQNQKVREVCCQGPIFTIAL